MNGLRLGAVTLIVADYDKAIRFFCDGLGFELTADLDQGHKRWVTVRPAGGGSDLVLAQPATAEQTLGIGSQGAGRVWLFLETTDFARDHAKLVAAGACFEEPPRYEPYGIVAVWRDPWGNRWDLLQRSSVVGVS